LNASGSPTQTFVDFDHTPSASNPNWKLTGTAEMYDLFGAVIQTSKPAVGGPLQTTTVNRNDLHLPVGSLTGAGFFESGVLTGDYDLNETEISGYYHYFDGTYGWEKDQGVLSQESVHFGQSSIKVPSGQGVMRNFKVRSGIKYVLTAWIKVTSATNFNINIEHRTGPSSITFWPVAYSDLNAPSSTDQYSYSIGSGQWQLAKIEIPAAVSGDNNWIRVIIGITGSSASAFVDNIRFAPARTKISTTYYDSKWQQPILSVDANNNPGMKALYDDWGRPIMSQKIDKYNPGSLVQGKVSQEKVYHMVGEQQTTPPFTPDPVKWYKIVFADNESYCIEIKNGVMNDGQEVQLNTYTGLNKQLWKFVPDGNGFYFVTSKQDTSYGINAPNGNTVDYAQLTISNVRSGNMKWKILDPGITCSGNCCKLASRMKYNALIDLYYGYPQPGQKVELFNDVPEGHASVWKAVAVP
jgi:hypothetical protein